MSHKHPSDEPTNSKSMHRREALKGLGALAISGPTLAAVGCSSEPSTGAANNPVIPSAAGTGVPPTTVNAGVPAAAAGSTSTTTGVAGTGLSGTGAAGTGSAVAGRSSPAPTSAGAPSTAGIGSAGRAGSSAGPGAAGGGGSPAISGGAPAMPAAGVGGTATGNFIPVMFDEVASCTMTPTDPAGEGPFFLHEDEVMNDDSLRRVDMRGGKPGVEFQLNLRVLDNDGMCKTPISGVEVYVWHTDALGWYSGFNGQDPDKSYMGGLERTIENNERFCRGIQVTDKDGIVRFRTLYPGWYFGRAVHIHFVALRPGSGPSTMSYRGSQYMVFTTQMYFAEQFTRMIHEGNDPYKTRASGSGYNMYVKPQNMTVNPTLRMEGNIAVGALNIVTSAKGSRR